MKILLVTDFPEYFIEKLEQYGDEILISCDIEITKEYLTTNRIEIILICGYNGILSHDVLVSATCIGIHFSMLPFGKGPEPILASWINNEPIGVTIYEMNEDLDGGPIIMQRTCPMDPESETLESSIDKLLECSSNLIDECWSKIRSGSFETEIQSFAGSHHNKKQVAQIFDLAVELGKQPVSVFLDNIQKMFPGFVLK